MKPVGLFFGRSWRERGLFFEATLGLIVAKLLVHTVPFRWFAPRLGRSQHETPRTIAPAARALAVDISWAVQAAARHLPLGFVCLPQAMAAQWMLRRRGLATTMYFGVAFKADARDSLLAHAWLRAGDKIVTGENEMSRHPAIAWFGDGGPAA